MKFLIDLFNHLLSAHPDGIILYIGGSATLTWVQIAYRAEVTKGLKGTNGLWEAPEWIIYLFSWFFPHMIMADQFLGLKASESAWLFMSALLLFALTGRFGLEWLLAMKTGTPKVIDDENKTP